MGKIAMDNVWIRNFKDAGTIKNCDVEIKNTEIITEESLVIIQSILENYKDEENFLFFLMLINSNLFLIFLERIF